MKWFRPLGKWKNLMTGFGFVSVVIALVGWLAIRNMAVLNAYTENTYQLQMFDAAQLRSMGAQLQEIRACTFRLLAGSPDVMRDRIAQASALNGQLTKRIDNFRRTSSPGRPTPCERTHQTEALRALARWISLTPQKINFLKPTALRDA